jgi:hypothetical protein
MPPHQSQNWTERGGGGRHFLLPGHIVGIAVARTVLTMLGLVGLRASSSEIGMPSSGQETVDVIEVSLVMASSSMD